MKQQCPFDKQQCTQECVAYCKLTKTKIYKQIPELKKCSSCGLYLVPYEGFWLHPQNKCKYAYMLEVQIKPYSKEYEKEFGKAEYSFQDLIKSFLEVKKGWFGKLKQLFF